MKRTIMEQSDLDLLHTVPPYHLQSLVKLRRPKGQNVGVLNVPNTPTAATLTEIAEQLFSVGTIGEAIRSLNDTEAAILRELVACGGRANSRDLALYLSNSNMFTHSKDTEHSLQGEQSSLLY